MEADRVTASGIGRFSSPANKLSIPGTRSRGASSSSYLTHFPVSRNSVTHTQVADPWHNQQAHTTHDRLFLLVARHTTAALLWLPQKSRLPQKLGSITTRPCSSSSLATPANESWCRRRGGGGGSVLLFYRCCVTHGQARTRVTFAALPRLLAKERLTQASPAAASTSDVRRGRGSI